ncbi:Serine phosphatase RsbU, regulator of sigma subunit [Olavius algarvensis Delta 1 endosymbiont]|nr:Serine phosphatase RsbU, regulator of sigma subunit [Olavius algarvensis Delta 1 endosymbiont]
MRIEDIIRNYLDSGETKTPQLSALTCQLLEYWATAKDFEIDNKLLQELVFNYAASEKKLKALNKELIWRQDRIDEDLAAAADIQRSLLPQRIDSVDHLAVAWKFKPCDKIGGDIFNMAQLDDKHWGIYMLDVSGHGVPAAMVAVSVFQNLHPQTGRILMRPGESRRNQAFRGPAKVLEKLDLEYTFDRFNNFFTINYVILNAATGEFTCSSAGHPPPIIIRQDGTLDIMTSGSPPIGTRDLRLVDEQITFPEEKRKLNTGDKLLLYTDGVFEHQNRQGEFYGNERFQRQLGNLSSRPISHILDTQFQELMEFGNGAAPKDDISLLGVEFKS